MSIHVQADAEFKYERGQFQLKRLTDTERKLLYVRGDEVLTFQEQGQHTTRPTGSPYKPNAFGVLLVAKGPSCSTGGSQINRG